MTAHQLYLCHAPALGIDSYATFCKLLDLLDRPGRAEFETNGKWFAYKTDTVGVCLLYAKDATNLTGKSRRSERVVLLDGVVIREWPIDEYDGIF